MGKMKIIRACVTLNSAILILSTLAIILSGCTAVRTDYLLLDPQTCRKNGVPIDIYYTTPKLSYTPVAKIEAIKLRGRGASWEDVKVALCRQAHALNLDVDGLIGIQEATVSSDATVGPIGTGGASEKLTAIAIHYDETVE
jgi:hypothetical protein